MLPLIYTNVISAAVFWVVFLAWMIVELLGPARWRAPDRAISRDRGSLFVALGVGWCGVLVCFFLPIWFPFAKMPGAPLLFFVVGFACMLLGIGWRWYAIRVLGRYFVGVVAVQSEQRVVQTGPYRLVRHPSYSGVLLVGVGVGLILMNWVSMSVLVGCLFAGMLYRILIEEKLLLESFGEEYRAYMSRTKRLIPFVF